jgi:hypothetical protein
MRVSALVMTKHLSKAPVCRHAFFINCFAGVVEEGLQMFCPRPVVREDESVRTPDSARIVCMW